MTSVCNRNKEAKSFISACLVPLKNINHRLPVRSPDYLCTKEKVMYQISGKIHVIRAEQVVSDKFKKREFVLVTGGNYPQYLSFQLTQNNCSQLDSVSTG